MTQVWYTVLSDVVDGLVLDVQYSEYNRQYKVIVHTEDQKIHRNRVIPALYRPIFGVDVDDMISIMSVAETLAQEIDDERARASATDL